MALGLLAKHQLFNYTVFSIIIVAVVVIAVCFLFCVLVIAAIVTLYRAFWTWIFFVILPKIKQKHSPGIIFFSKKT